jgi:hypothetical protein
LLSFAKASRKGIASAVPCRIPRYSAKVGAGGTAFRLFLVHRTFFVHCDSAPVREKFAKAPQKGWHVRC